MITAVGVVVPARNERARIGACMQSIQQALLALPTALEHAVCVVLDRCTDDTAGVVGTIAGTTPGWVCEASDRAMSIGALRHQGSLTILRQLRQHRPNHVWLLNTDADTVVPPNWAVDHCRYATRGAGAVAGIADLHGFAHLHPRAATAYRALIRRMRHENVHTQVYGANLGVRADAYLAVGGFHPTCSGEDADLVERLELAGFEVARPVEVRVATSARLQGRAPAGLASLLAGLQQLATAAEG